MQQTDLLKDILLAEDDLEDVFIFELAIKELPYPLVLRHATDGDMLFVLIKETIPDIIFLDIHLPCKDGVTCISEIRKNEDLNHVPVIMYTSHSSKQYINECYKGGANFYVLKADTVQHLVTNLNQIFAIDWKRFVYYPPISQFVVGA